MFKRFGLLSVKNKANKLITIKAIKNAELPMRLRVNIKATIIIINDTRNTILELNNMPVQSRNVCASDCVLSLAERFNSLINTPMPKHKHSAK